MASSLPVKVGIAAGAIAVSVAIGIWFGAGTAIDRASTSVPIASPSPAAPVPQARPPTSPPKFDPAPNPALRPQQRSEDLALALPPARSVDPPPWRRNAVATDPPGDKPLIAIVIDDAGLGRRNTLRLNRLPGPLTIAFMAYADDLEVQVAAARRAGHEIWLHMPMEPLDAHEEPGPRALLTHLDDAELKRRIAWMLGRIDRFVGLNNHMGSKFTAQAAGMTLVMEAAKERGLAFLDSRTTSASIGVSLAQRFGVPNAARDVFLDNVQTADSVRGQLKETEDIARRQNSAIAIGHPHNATIEALEAWAYDIDRRGFTLVPVSSIILKRSGS